jgi:hypothetical protein
MLMNAYIYTYIGKDVEREAARGLGRVIRMKKKSMLQRTDMVRRMMSRTLSAIYTYIYIYIYMYTYIYMYKCIYIYIFFHSQERQEG